MQHQVHQREPVRILHVLHAEERAAAIFLLLRFGPAVRGTVLAYVAVGGDQKSAGTGGRVLNDVGEPRVA